MGFSRLTPRTKLLMALFSLLCAVVAVVFGRYFLAALFAVGALARAASAYVVRNVNDQAHVDGEGEMPLS